MADHVIVVIMLLVFFTSMFKDKPTKSPALWLIIGLVILLTHSLDAWNWYHSPLLDDTNNMDPVLHDQVEESVMKEYWHSILFAGVGVVISIASAVKLIQGKKD